MKYYNVKFTFEIPVMVKDEGDVKEVEIDAYFEARKEFPQYNVNEASVSLEKLNEDEFKSKRSVIDKLHKKK